MKWIRERDALIAQTLAFVQSVTGRNEDFPPPQAPAAASAVITEIVAVRAAAVEIEPPAATSPLAALQPRPVQVPPPRTGVDVRTEMQARIVSFRKHQERFQREREEYCAATLSRLRAAIRDIPSRPPADK
ncbi:hypothetical protein FXV83_04345 [Bradyrhizobium hipponense]|uniref:Uncharacterized protein n=1 Tax=Bradyrhizobium hipponense TaxID=2605638 RepID=A0A5S4YXL5_9BRAD|nr:hypothetical protein [Bradyrhizobium hipponense]TYO67999.1 hypothetical protein FXV83_04345 [Bradyrhizobium hipponense]